MSMIKKNWIHCAGQYTTVGAAVAQNSPPANQPSFFTLAYTGVGTVTITLDEQIDPTERVELVSSGQTLLGCNTLATGTDATVLCEQFTESGAPGATEGVVNFMIIRVAG